MMARVEEIYIAPQGGAPMRRLAEVQALEGQGLEGDRYCRRLGYWSGFDECQVTLIRAEDLEEIHRSTGLQVENGEHRRNLIVRGLALEELAGCRFQVGEAVLEYDRPRPPCAYIQSLTEPGMARALLGRGGICARVVGSGKIRVGDALQAL